MVSKITDFTIIAVEAMFILKRRYPSVVVCTTMFLVRFRQNTTTNCVVVAQGAFLLLLLIIANASKPFTIGRTRLGKP